MKIEGNLRVLQAGQIVASRSFPVSTFLNASGTGAATSSTWGFHDFCETREVHDSFIVEADITLRDRAKEPSFQVRGPAHVTSVLCIRPASLI